MPASRGGEKSADNEQGGVRIKVWNHGRGRIRMIYMYLVVRITGEG